MSVWKKLTHLVPSIRRAEERDIAEELESLRRIAGARELGNLAIAGEDARAAFQFLWLERLIQDLRYAWRSMWHDKVFALLATASLALGIGASAAIYSFVDAILLRSLPVARPESLVMMKFRAKTQAIASDGMFYDDSITTDDQGKLNSNLPYPALKVFNDSRDVLANAFAYAATEGLSVSVGNETDEASGQLVSGGYFDTLGVAPAAGRLIQSSDDEASSAAVAVVSQRFVQNRFGDAARAVGQTIRINDKPFSVIGVAPSSFFGVEAGTIPDIYIPLHATAILDPASGASNLALEHYYWLKIMGRLQPGVSLDRAQTLLMPRFQQFVAASATTDRQRQDLPELRLQPGGAGLDRLRRQFVQPIYVLAAVVGAILLIACSNLANLLLARASARRREIAIRLGIGAGRARVVRQLLTESLLLASLGGAVGLALAWWSIPVITSLLANGRGNFTMHAGLNWRVLAIAVGLSLATGFLFGLAPAIQATRVDIARNLKSVPAGTSRRRRSRVAFSHGLVVTQIALSLLMLVFAGLLGDTLANLHSINIGFNRDNVLLFTIRPEAVGYKPDERLRLFEDLRARIGLLPGVARASLSVQPLPMGGGTMMRMKIVDLPVASANGQPPTTVIASVGPNFFATMQIPLIAGREFTDADRADAPKVMVVNRKFAHAVGVDNPVGHVVAIRQTPVEIVGVVDDALSFSLKDDLRPAAYFPYLQSDRPAGAMTYEVRTIGRPLNFVESVTGLVRGTDSRLALFDMKTQAAHIDRAISSEITLATLCSTFAVVALVIACVGLYGTVAFNVARRTNEIGIRMALGASGRRITWMVLRDVLVLAMMGFAAGLPLVFLGTRYVASFLYGITPHDPRAIAAAIAALLVCAMLAGLVPALRASRIAPMGAVRRE